MEKLSITYKNVGELIPYKNNPRLNESGVAMVANSIREFGFRNPIIIDAQNVIIAGHTRIKAAIKLGLEQVPCVVADDLNEEQARALRVIDNKVAELAEWDHVRLEEELNEIYLMADEMAMELFDFTPYQNEKEGIEIGASGKEREDMEEIKLVLTANESNNLRNIDSGLEARGKNLVDWILEVIK